YWMIIVILIAGGFMRSLFFTSCNALAFAEIDDRQAGQATAIAAAVQQISIALGGACAGGLLEMVTAFSGGALDRSAFAIAFVVAGVAAALATIVFVRLPRHAGSAMSGHSARGAGERPELQE